jgi:large conductance mechanosensitive channel
MLQGFKKFLMQGDLVIIAVGLAIALGFSTLVKAFSDSIVTPLVNAAAGGGASAKGLTWTVNGQTIQFGAFISAIVYFVILTAIIYFILVVPYRAYMRRRGSVVFGDAPPTKTCPSCLSDDIPAAATRCKHCTIDLPANATPAMGTS